MNNVNFINYLQNLTTDRFALNTLSASEFNEFRAWLLTQFRPHTASHKLITQSNPACDWYLIGTDGCHLCEMSLHLIQQTSSVYPNIATTHYLDVIDGYEPLIDNLGKIIPVLLTPYHLLCYPFGVMDIVMVNSSQNHVNS